MTPTDRLELAVLRLIQFRQGLKPAAVIDPHSNLLASDLDRIIARLKETWDVVSIEQIDLRDMAALERFRAERDGE